MFKTLYRVAPMEWNVYMRKGNIANLKNICKLCRTRWFTGSSTFQTTIHAVRFKQQATPTFLCLHRFIQVPSPLGNESAFDEWIRKIPNRLGLNYLPRWSLELFKKWVFWVPTIKWSFFFAWYACLFWCVCNYLQSFLKRIALCAFSQTSTTKGRQWLCQLYPTSWNPNSGHSLHIRLCKLNFVGTSLDCST